MNEICSDVSLFPCPQGFLKDPSGVVLVFVLDSQVLVLMRDTHLTPGPGFCVKITGALTHFYGLEITFNLTLTLIVVV